MLPMVTVVSLLKSPVTEGGPERVAYISASSRRGLRVEEDQW